MGKKKEEEKVYKNIGIKSIVSSVLNEASWLQLTATRRRI